MSIVAIAQGIFAVAKVFPTIQNIIEMVYGFYVDWRLDQIDDKYDEKTKQRKALVSAIKKAGTNEERMHLSKLMFDLIHSR